jgi:hypothetical protein
MFKVSSKMGVKISANKGIPPPVPCAECEVNLALHARLEKCCYRKYSQEIGLSDKSSLLFNSLCS